MIDLVPFDGSDPIENARVIIEELERYSADLGDKPRWLIFNKTDLMLEDEVEDYIQTFMKALDWDLPYHKISAINRDGTLNVTRELMQFLESLPKAFAEPKEAGKVEFKWQSYHDAVIKKEVVDIDDDFDFDDDLDDASEGVQVFYER